jgi:hypothetical protein
MRDAPFARRVRLPDLATRARANLSAIGYT